jgi:hypothetical protein
MEYPKINSLFKRNPTDNTFIFGDYACPEFTLIKQWRVEEKVDGTNVRIIFEPAAEHPVTILGRSKDSGMPTFLVDYLKAHFTAERLSAVFDIQHKCILYGEGYGSRIQSAGPYYRKDVSFMLFDIHIGSFWLTRETVQEKARQLDVSCPPDLGLKTEAEIIEFVQSKPQSVCSYKPQVMEGIIARPEPLLLFRNNKPLVWKLKVRDFE